MSKDAPFTHYFSTAPNQLDLFGERGAHSLPATGGASRAFSHRPQSEAGGQRSTAQIRAAIDARSEQDWAEVLVAALATGAPQTFETLASSLAGASADQACGTTAEAGLWLAVEQGRVLHTKGTPLLFRCADKAATKP